MKREEKPISEYLDLICSLIIDQFNVKYDYRNYIDEKQIKVQLAKDANERYVESDWVYRIGEYFKDLVYYEFREEINNEDIDNQKKKTKKNNYLFHDIWIPSKDFIIEIKYLKNWKANDGESNSNSTIWKNFVKDFQWLENELVHGKKGKRAFVIVWCNCLDYFGQVMQLGTKQGAYKNPVNNERLVYFPFLMNNKSNYTRDFVYNYNKEFPCQLDLNIIGKGNVNMHCLFLGDKDDRLHFAIYY